jgi:peptidoglycan LD-endopeptidase CwlK
MGYISTADQFGQFLSGCGTGCSCRSCGPRGAFGEWYVPEEDQDGSPSPAAAAASSPERASEPAQNGNPLSGWNGLRRGSGSYRYDRLGFYSQAPAPAPTGVPGPPAPFPNLAPRLDPLNRLAGVHPELARRIAQTATALFSRGIPVTITRTGGLRTFAEQATIYAQGRTTPGRIVTHAAPGLSNHNYGLAVDLVPLVNGRPNWQVPLTVWQAIGGEGIRAGLSWGGNWTMVRDYPHFELPVGLSVQQCLRIYNQGGLPAVWAEANRRLATR